MNTPIGNRNLYNILQIVFASFYTTILFMKDHNGNAATLLFCVIPAIATYIEYIQIWVENVHLK